MSTKKFQTISYLVLAISVLQISCKHENSTSNLIADFFKPAVVDIAEVEKNLHLSSTFTIQELVHNDSSFYQGEIQAAYNLSKVYWFDEFGLNENGKKLLTQIQIAQTEGLNPEDYFYSEIDSAINQITNLDAKQLSLLELKMSYAYLKFSKHLLLGRVVPLELNKNWQNKNDTTWRADSAMIWVTNKPLEVVLNALRPAHPWYDKFWQTAKRITHLNEFNFNDADLPKDLNIGDSSQAIQNLRNLLAAVEDSTLDKNAMIWDLNGLNALRSYQQSFALEETGKLDSATLASLTKEAGENLRQLGFNMERLRWLQKDLGKEYIWVNIPQMEVKYFEKDTITFAMNAVVGKFSRKTPTLDSRMSNIVFNPPWYVPPTILKQEIIPGIRRRGGSYLRRRGLVARDSRGRVVNASRINSKNFRRYSISQNPGRYSALGSVKFNFPNKEAIFLHDTNHRDGFTRKYRATSSGCIRVHHPKDFARFLLRDSSYSSYNIDSIINKKRTKSVKIKRDIGVHLVYLTNAVDSAGRVIKVPDIYKWDQELTEVL